MGIAPVDGQYMYMYMHVHVFTFIICPGILCWRRVIKCFILWRGDGFDLIAPIGRPPVPYLNGQSLVHVLSVHSIRLPGNGKGFHLIPKSLLNSPVPFSLPTQFRMWHVHAFHMYILYSTRTCILGSIP